MTASNVKIAAVQAEPVWLDMPGTVAKTIDLMRRAAANEAELIAFPETWIPGYPVFLWSHPVYAQADFVRRYHENSPTIDGPEIAEIRQAAAELGLMVVLGLSEKDSGSLYMGQLIIGSDGEILLHRRKLKPTHAERTLFGEGDGSGLKVVETPLGRIGTLQCFEHLQPLSKYAMYAQNEQIHIAAWPCLGVLAMNPILSPESIMATTQTYAAEGSGFVISTSQIMSEEGARVFSVNDGEPTPVYTGGGGFARVYGPDSALRTQQLRPAEEGIVYSVLDLGEIASAKNTLDPAGHYARPDVTQLLLNDEPQRPVIRVGGASPLPSGWVEDPAMVPEAVVPESEKEPARD